MTPVTAFADQHLALFGLGGSGLATAEALLAGGAQVTAWDDSETSREAARTRGIKVADLRDADWSGFSALVLAPGVPLTHPEPHWTATLAQAAGLPVIGDIELFCRERAKVAPDAPLIAITGTNGKSTTTALIAHLCRSAGWDTQMGGNIGVPVLALDPPANNRVHVLELSSFQIDLAPSLHASVGILLNLTPDHIDRHGTMENYAAIKERLVASSDRALVGVDDPHSAAIAARVKASGITLTTISVAGRPADVTLDGTRLMRNHDTLADLAGVATLRGRHNAQNAAVAIVAVQAVASMQPASQPIDVPKALHGFGGLPHRMEQVGQRGHVLFVNDSKATNADAAEQSLKSFDPVFWIVGGVAKEGGLAPLAPVFGRVAKAYLIGTSSAAFAAELDGHVEVEDCGTLDVAVAAAARDAARSDAAEPVVLLAPACASYDQFKNFEQRGTRFRELVEALPASLAGQAEEKSRDLTR
ncbi:UDP-N-acetylmuramoyl-L-alanine--D-glutamate ligase [Lichenihabitans psoromatis]|uniref:UDP-N-acetylmuramoyl-L-alanine--D-glutamate ligase n=1 Tax=Lichenihabitans psoromatis TaxID=2528642 RepID=UPI001035FEFB|nr:UDP-N-acetylmuramoyl-L-alanine--D-glutamate ligase [Lichenihabitans psoromatis]